MKQVPFLIIFMHVFSGVTEAQAFGWLWAKSDIGVNENQTYKDFILNQNQPYPFSRLTTNTWKPASRNQMVLKVSGFIGREVKTHVDTDIPLGQS
jgi:hypothetical protein